MKLREIENLKEKVVTCLENEVLTVSQMLYYTREETEEGTILAYTRPFIGSMEVNLDEVFNEDESMKKMEMLFDENGTTDEEEIVTTVAMGIASGLSVDHLNRMKKEYENSL